MGPVLQVKLAYEVFHRPRVWLPLPESPNLFQP